MVKTMVKQAVLLQPTEVNGGADIHLQPMLKTMVKQAVLLQPTEVNGGADIHLQPMEEPVPEQHMVIYEQFTALTYSGMFHALHPARHSFRQLANCHKWGAPGINTFISGIENTLTKFADNSKLGGEVDMSEGLAILQRNLDRLEEWTIKNCMEFNKDKYKVLHIGQHNQRVQFRLGSVWLGSSLAEKDLGVLVDNKLDMIQQCVSATTKANQILGYIHKDIISRDRM
ncbi:rna-directed dna polymerase from mobile element jockey-like [Limosa lapponica baueri]|uniref:Rna-directed dna polymerase from mobile element jockey-like n=1 Tax=Limosa lapponica baueri TaxID=1758121 RepID=A0A2I0UIE9_LIMLA|nr:rna-directed dna polymerase from mobile element jockey-like [Limosa lapponica baueri]